MPGIEVTKVEVRIPKVLRSNRSLRAYAKVTFNDAIAVDNFRIEQALNGRMSLGFPLRPKRIICRKCGRSAFANQARCGHCLDLIIRKGFSRDYIPAVVLVDRDVHRSIEMEVLRAYAEQN